MGVRCGKRHGECSPCRVRFTVAAIPDPVRLPSLLIAIKDTNIESKCVKFQYTKETFDLCKYFCGKRISRLEKCNL